MSLPRDDYRSSFLSGDMSGLTDGADDSGGHYPDSPTRVSSNSSWSESPRHNYDRGNNDDRSRRYPRSGYGGGGGNRYGNNRNNSGYGGRRSEDRAPYSSSSSSRPTRSNQQQRGWGSDGRSRSRGYSPVQNREWSPEDFKSKSPSPVVTASNRKMEDVFGKSEFGSDMNTEMTDKPTDPASEEARRILKDIINATDLINIPEDILVWTPPKLRDKDEVTMKPVDEFGGTVLTRSGEDIIPSFVFDPTKDISTVEKEAVSCKHRVDKLTGRESALEMIRTCLLFLEVIALKEVNRERPKEIAQYATSVRKLADSFAERWKGTNPVMKLLLHSFSLIAHVRKVEVYKQSVNSSNKALYDRIVNMSKDSTTSSSTSSSTPSSSTSEKKPLTPEDLNDIQWLLIQQRGVCEAFDRLSHVLKLTEQALPDSPELRRLFECVPVFCPQMKVSLVWAYNTARSLQHLFPRS